MYSVYRNFGQLQRGAYRAHITLCNHRINVKPLILQTVHFSKSKGSDGEVRLGNDGKKLADGKKPPMSKKGPVGPPKIDMRIIPASYHNLSYEELNKKLGRAMSPHLSIYKKQLTSVMSIFLRISGFILGIGIWTIGLTGLLCDIDVNAMAEKIEKCDCSRTVFNMLKLFIIIPFAYHIVAGTRHLIWHLNVFLSKREIYATGYAAIVLTFILAAALAGIDVQEKTNELSKVSNDGEITLELKTLLNEETEEIDEHELDNEMTEADAKEV
ncbi:succinate dehydrogenase cytochrome b560 subunit, mitochondrial [Drosophila virilis]|uniref:Uncharacterized protein n=1 Tax=Drosophila virilis TaxID=7244 RepID=B4LYF8_DROVI|nr:uncharacterized protein LOC6630324 [Drosophila virilis]EDW66954.1 uncharacterized protein Dvir_GJ23876 [Drosophila virilis]